MQIFFSRQNKKFFCLDKIKCNSCSKTIQKIGLLVGDWQKKDSLFQSDVLFYCHKCKNKIKKNGIAQNIFIVLFISYLPDNVIPVVIKPPDLIISRSCSEAALDLKDGARIIDNARISRDPNRNIMQGALEHKEIIENRIALLDSNNVSSANQVCKDALNSKPMIDHKNKKLITG